jgi:hypothetical protein
MVHGAWCMVHGAWCVVRGAWCMVRGAWCVGSLSEESLFRIPNQVYFFNNQQPAATVQSILTFFSRFRRLSRSCSHNINNFPS